MADLSPEAKRMLAALRDVDNPTARERASGDAAVRRMLEAHGVHRPAPAPKHVASLKLTWVLGATLAATAAFFAVNSSTKPEPPLQRQHTAPAPTAAPSDTVSPQPTAAEVSPPLPAATPRRAASAARKPSKSADDSLAAELRFVASVDGEIRAGSYERALKLLQHHKASTPLLQEERSAMRVLALCGRDHDAHAQRERDQFLKLHPSSLLSARVRAACSGAP